MPGLVAQRLLGALLGGERRRLVDVPGAQRGVGEYRDFGVLHLERSAADEEVVLLAIGRLHAHFAWFQQSEQWCVARINPEVALGRGCKHRGGRAREKLALGAHDVDMNGRCFRHGAYCRVFALATASSIEPTM